MFVPAPNFENDPIKQTDMLKKKAYSIEDFLRTDDQQILKLHFSLKREDYVPSPEYHSNLIRHEIIVSNGRLVSDQNKDEVARYFTISKLPFLFRNEDCTLIQLREVTEIVQLNAQRRRKNEQAEQNLEFAQDAIQSLDAIDHCSD